MRVFTEKKNFYPTPKEVIEKMITCMGKDISRCTTVLEPSAGKGDLADGLRNAFYHEPQMDCVELDAELAHTLRGKGYPTVQTDFLTYYPDKKYGFIVLNPPFDKGASHLLHAMELQRDGGRIICLLNAETLKNPYSKERKLLVQKLEEYGAEIQYLQDAFLTESTERKTDVEVALVSFTIPERKKCSFIIEELKRATEEQYQDAEATAVVSGDFFHQMVQQYQFEMAAGKRLIQEAVAMEPYLLNSMREYSQPILQLNLTDVNEFVRKLRHKYWDGLFQAPQFVGLLTSNLQKELKSIISKMVNYDFSLENIQFIKEQIMGNLVGGVEDTIMELFEKLSAEYSWYPECQKNIHYYNGWASNQAHKINKKVILPINGFHAYGFSKGKLDLYYLQSVLSDIEKALNYLDDGTTAPVDLMRVLERANQEGSTKKIPLKYFRITLYKKGTCHIEFTNPDLLDKLNIFGSRKRGWLPPCYGRKTYSNMTGQEKSVIDEFQGKDAYEEVLNRKEYFLPGTLGVMSLENFGSF